MTSEPQSPDSPGSSLRLHTVRGLFWAAVQRSGGQLLSLAAFIVLSRLLEPSAFGLLALAYAYLMVALLLVEQGVHPTIIQRAELTRDHLDTAFCVSLAFSAVLTGATLAAAGPISTVFREPMLAPVLRAMSPVLVLAGLRATQTALLQRQLRFRELALRTGVAELVGGAFGVGMAVAGAGVWSLVGQALGRGVAAVVILWRVTGWRPRLRIVRSSLGEISRFSLPVLGDRLVQLAQGKADDLIIGLVLGATPLGFYSVAYRMLNYLTQLLVGTVQSVALPILSRVQGEADRFRRIFLAMLEYLSLGAFPVFVGIAFVAPDIVPLVFGDRWTPSIPAMQLLALAGAVKAIPLATATALVARGRPNLQFRVNLATTVLLVGGFAAVVKSGILAVAAVHLVVGILVIPVHAAILRASLVVHPIDFARALRASVAGVAAMAAGLIALGTARSGGSPSWGWLALAVAIAAAVYTIAVYLLGRASIDRAREALREGVLTSGPPPALDFEPSLDLPA